MHTASVGDECKSAPEGMEHPFLGHLTHQCMPDALRCVYCDEPLAPYNCNGCGKFIGTEKMNAEEWRCDDCI